METRFCRGWLDNMEASRAQTGMTAIGAKFIYLNGGSINLNLYVSPGRRVVKFGLRTKAEWWNKKKKKQQEILVSIKACGFCRKRHQNLPGVLPCR